MSVSIESVPNLTVKVPTFGVLIKSGKMVIENEFCGKINGLLGSIETE